MYFSEGAPIAGRKAPSPGGAYARLERSAGDYLHVTRAPYHALLFVPSLGLPNLHRRHRNRTRDQLHYHWSRSSRGVQSRCAQVPH